MATQFRQVAEQYDDCFESLGLDEIDLDVTLYLKENGLDSEEG